MLLWIQLKSEKKICLSHPVPRLVVHKSVFVCAFKQIENSPSPQKNVVYIQNWRELS